MTNRRPPLADPPADPMPADAHLWDDVRATIAPLVKQDVAPPPAAPPRGPGMRKTAETPAPPVSASLKPLMPLTWNDAGGVSRGDKTRIKQGVLRPALSFDLHGMTVARAEGALMAFLARAVRDGHPWVEIITGHGRMKTDGAHPGERETGVLKRLLPEWLNRPAHRLHIKRVLPAPRSRGGAVWVALKAEAGNQKSEARKRKT